MLKKILLVFVSILAVAACAQGIKSIEQNKQVNKTPSQVVKEFYHWYISSDDLVDSLIEGNKYKGKDIYTYVSKELVDKIQEARKYFGGDNMPANLSEYMDGADYFLKVQDFNAENSLKTMKIIKEEIKSDVAKVCFNYFPVSGYHSYSTLVILKREKNTWKIIKVNRKVK